MLHSNELVGRRKGGFWRSGGFGGNEIMNRECLAD